MARLHSPVLGARLAGALWLAVIAASALAFVPTSSMILRNDAAATATNILANESPYRLSVVAELVAGMLYLGVTVLLYELLRPVNRSLSLVAAFFGLGGVIVGGMNFLSRLVPLALLQGDQHLSVFTTGQLQAMVLMALDLHGLGLITSLVLFGIQCFIAGYLIARSAFLPRILGVLLAIGGSSYLIHSFTSFLSPSLGAVLSPLVGPLALAGEGSVSLWLLVKGVDAPRWTEQAGTGGRIEPGDDPARMSAPADGSAHDDPSRVPQGRAAPGS